MKPFPVWRTVFSVLGIGLATLFFFSVWQLLIPFVLGLIAAYLVQPLIDRFVSMGMRRDRTVLVMYALLMLSVIGFGYLIVTSLVSEANAALRALPEYMAKFNVLNDSITAELNKWSARFMGKKAHPIILPFRAEILADRFLSSIPANISSVAHLGLWVLIIPFVCYFSLAQGKEWMNRLFDWTPSEYVESLLGLVAEVNATLGAYIRGQLLDGMCVGVMTMGGLWMLGFDQAVLMGLLAGFLNPVPFLAPVVGGSITILIAYFQGMTVSSLVGIFCLFMLVRLCDDFIFTPFIVGQSVQLHPVVMVFAILAGVEVGGFLGLVFAVPVAAILKVVLSIVLTSRRENLVLGQNHIVS